MFGDKDPGPDLEQVQRCWRDKDPGPDLEQVQRCLGIRIQVLPWNRYKDVWG
jgi:hypothetical protein